MRVLYVTSEWPTRENPHWVPFLKQEVEHLRKAGIKVDVFSFRGRKNPFRYMDAWLQLREKISPMNYDLIHAQFGQSGLISLPASLPLIVTFHGSDLQGWINGNGRYTIQGRVMGLISRAVARKADRVIVVSNHLAKYLPNKIPARVIPCGIDLDLFSPEPIEKARRELSLPLGKRLVLFPANPNNPIKRYNLARDAVALLKSRFELDLIALCNIPHQKVPVYMNACDALLLTSKHEGSPVVIKEALACNLPVVSVDVGDVKEFISLVPGCRLCEDDSPETIAAELTQVLNNSKRVEGRRAVEHLSWEITTKKIIGVYQEALETGSGS